MSLYVEPRGSWLSFSIWFLFFILCSSVVSRASAFEIPEPRYISWNPRTLVIDETTDLASRDVGEAHSFGLKFNEGPIPILPQAVGGILTQAMYKAFLQLGPIPLGISNSFEHDYSEIIESKICFDVGINVTAATNMSGIYMMTNRRIATVLDLMGFDFSHHEDMNALREYNFDILVTNEEREMVIGHGTLKNGQVRPSVSRNRWVWPRCSGSVGATTSRRTVPKLL